MERVFALLLAIFLNDAEDAEESDDAEEGCSIYIQCMYIRMHERLVTWKEAYALCLHLYTLSGNFPTHERFGLASQLRRSAFSIPANIAEGNTRRTAKDKMHFLDMAMASLEETHVAVLLARDLAYLSLEAHVKIDDHINRISYLIVQLRHSLQKTD